MMQLEHQIQDTPTQFKHRLVPKGTDRTKESPSGKWVNYTTPAAYYTTKGVFIAVTDYFRDSVEFPDPGKIYWVQEAPTDI